MSDIQMHEKPSLMVLEGGKAPLSIAMAMAVQQEGKALLQAGYTLTQGKKGWKRSDVTMTGRVDLDQASLELLFGFLFNAANFGAQQPSTSVSTAKQQ